MQPQAVEGQPVQPATSLKSRAIRGTAISFLGQMAGNGVRLISNIILGHLLFPEAFGLMALVTVAMTGLEMLSDLGVKISIIQSNRGDDRDFLDTAFTISLIRGAVLFIAGCLIAWPFAYAYDEPRLIAMVQVTSLIALFNGAQSTALATLNRHIALGRVVAVTLVSQVSGSVLMIVLAAMYRSVWALVAGVVATNLVTLLMSHVFVPGPRNRLRWDKDAARSIVSFGKWIFLSTLITFAANYAHTLILGKLVTKDILGVYNMGGSLAALPLTAGGQVIGLVLLPALSESFRKDHETLVASFNRARSIILPLAGFMALGVALASPAFFTYFYDERYHAAAWITPLLVFTTYLIFLQEASGRALQAMGDAKSLFIANFAKLFVTIGASIAGYELGGLAGFIGGTILGAAAGQAVLIWRLHVQRLPAGSMDLFYTAILAAICGVGYFAPKYLSPLVGVSSALLSIPIGLVFLVPIGWWAAKRTLNEVRKK